MKKKTEKLTAAKLKAHLAMAAFILVAIATITLTSAGLFGYIALHAGVEPDTSQASGLSAPFSPASPLSQLATAVGR